jgi:hypothetical protein
MVPLGKRIKVTFHYKKKCLLSKYVASFDGNTTSCVVISVAQHNSMPQLTVKVII